MKLDLLKKQKIALVEILLVVACMFPQRVSAPILPALCIAAAGALAAGAIVYLYSCGPKYYCGQLVDDNDKPESAFYCLAAECRRSLPPDFRYKSGPHRDAMICGGICATNNSPNLEVPKSTWATYTAHVMRSTNLFTWLEVMTASNIDPLCFEFELKNQPSVQAFYRIDFN